VFAFRIVFLVRTEGAAAGTVGVLISLGGLLGAALASRAVSRFGSARTYLAINLATAPFILLPLLATSMRTLRDFPAQGRDPGRIDRGKQAVRELEPRHATAGIR
jgi:uncharacterized membrane protein YdfJ with MMPL/SSD domain